MDRCWCARSMPPWSNSTTTTLQTCLSAVGQDKCNTRICKASLENILNEANSKAGKIGKESLDANNRFVIMVNAGSKGSDINISQMIGRVARIFPLTSPPTIKEFKISIIDYNSSLFVSEISIERQSFEANELEFDGPDKLWNSVEINNSGKKFFKNT